MYTEGTFVAEQAYIREFDSIPDLNFKNLTLLPSLGLNLYRWVTARPCMVSVAGRRSSLTCDRRVADILAMTSQNEGQATDLGHPRFDPSHPSICRASTRKEDRCCTMDSRQLTLLVSLPLYSSRRNYNHIHTPNTTKMIACLLPLKNRTSHSPANFDTPPAPETLQH